MSASQQLLLGGKKAEDPVYIEDVFSTWLYTGNGSTQTITNGIDLAGKGGLVWMKSRDNPYSHALIRQNGASAYLSTDTTFQDSAFSGLVNYLTSGFKLNGINNNRINVSGDKYASWTFRKQPKFFDVVTYTGDGAASRDVAHNLGSAPGFVIVKRTDAFGTWIVGARTSGSGSVYLALNETSQSGSGDTLNGGSVENQYCTPTTFRLEKYASGVQNTNASGGTYVAYLFAHNAGGFGLTGTDNVISCGSYTGNGSTAGPVVNLGYEPQWILIKNASDGTRSWTMFDSMRGLTVEGSTDAYLAPNTSAEENSASSLLQPLATGFQINTSLAAFNGNGNTFIYIAIRRGPMKVPTTGTSVFVPSAVNAATGTNITTGFPVDLCMEQRRSGDSTFVVDRLRGVNTTTSDGAAKPYLSTQNTSAELTDTALSKVWGNTGIQVPSNYNGSSAIFWNFRRAPGFFDEVCYTGTGSARTVTHNLAAVPELMIVKQRNAANDWPVYVAPSGNNKVMYLNFPDAQVTRNEWNVTTPTASVFSLNSSAAVNKSGSTYAAYLFATCPGVSKVGSYTGTGATQTINCGFTAGARFVMIKRTDSTGDWKVYDTARGIVAAGDPVLLMNSTAAEDNSYDAIDTAASGFAVNSNLGGLSINGATYIFLAIA